MERFEIVLKYWRHFAMLAVSVIAAILIFRVGLAGTASGPGEVQPVDYDTTLSWMIDSFGEGARVLSVEAGDGTIAWVVHTGGDRIVHRTYQEFGDGLIGADPNEVAHLGGNGAYSEYERTAHGDEARGPHSTLGELAGERSTMGDL